MDPHSCAVLESVKVLGVGALPGHRSRVLKTEVLQTVNCIGEEGDESKTGLST